MTFIKIDIHQRKSNRIPLFNKKRILNQLIFLFLILGFSTACSDFVEIDPPKNILVTETVFNDPSTVKSALANIFYKMREQGMTSGSSGITTFLGTYSDELDSNGYNVDFSQFYLNNVTPTNTIILDWWSQAYKIIYSANSIIEGVDNSQDLTIEDKVYFKGQALFVRAYIHSLLVNIYGDVPYITTTDYIENNSVSRLSTTEVNDMIIQDLVVTVNLLENTGDPSGEKVLPGLSTAKALLARVYLYNKNWELAEATATQVISNFDLEPNLNDVFLKESSEAIWQFKPGQFIRNTLEANQLIIQSIPGQYYALTESLMSAFENGDLRSINWVGSKSNADNTITLPFAYKYKASFLETETLEYSIIFRLAEQYLIRAEARAYQGEITGAQQDLNTIRNRAGLSNTTATSESDLLEAILQERRVELFTELGQRWFDLKRTNNASRILNPIKANWQETDIILPIPENELEINPNLLPQNSGY